jgi:adenylate kinase
MKCIVNKNKKQVFSFVLASAIVCVIGLNDAYAKNQVHNLPKRQQAILFLGGPASGKGTMINKIAQDYPSAAVIGPGQLIRDRAKIDANFKKETQKFTNEGKMVPNSVIFPILGEALKGTSSASGVMFDGFPRVVEQAKGTPKLLSDNNLELCAVIVVNADDSVMAARSAKRAATATEKRADDTPEIFAKRIKQYHTESEPAIAFFNKNYKGKVYEIDGNKDTKDNYPQVQQIVSNCFGK